MIYFDKVTKVYPNAKALEDVTFTVESGEFVSIVGHSGAGKTTLLKMILAEDKPSAGQVFFDSINIHKTNRRDIPRLRRRIGSVFQDFRLLPNKTAYENIAFTMVAAGRSDEEIALDVPHALELVGLGDKKWNFPSELSGGERQRVAIARAIINQPDLLIADEPTGNLDTATSKQVMNLLCNINKQGNTIIIVTHSDEIASYAKRKIIIRDGLISKDIKI